MRVRNLSCACAALLAVGMAVGEARAEGAISAEALSDMGLGGMTIMSDGEALAVRGFGYKGSSSVAVFGNSFATINSKFGSAHSENGYAAEGKHYAKGSNHSFAGVEFQQSGGGHGGKGAKNHSPKWGGGKGSYGKGSYGKQSGHWGGKRGGYGGGKPGGGGHYGGGAVRTTSVRVFSGGFSSAKAW